MFTPGPLTAWEARELNRLSELLRQNPPVVRAAAPIMVTKGQSETILSLNGTLGGSSSSSDLCDYDTTGLVGSTAGSPAGSSFQWLGDQSKGIYDGALYIAGSDTLSGGLAGRTVKVVQTATPTPGSTTDPSGTIYSVSQSFINGQSGADGYCNLVTSYGSFNLVHGYLTTPSHFPLPVSLGSVYTRSAPPYVTFVITDFGNVLLGQPPAYCTATSASSGGGRMWVGGTFDIPAGSVVKVAGGIVWDYGASPPPISPPPVVSPPVVPPTTTWSSPPPLAISPPPPPSTTDLRTEPLDFGAILMESEDRATAKLRLAYTFADVTTDPQEGAVTGPTYAAGVANDVVVPDGAIVYIDAVGAATWTGIAAKSPGTTQFVILTGSETIVIQHDDAGSSAANRVLTHTSSPITYSPNEGFMLTYGNDSRWHIPFGA